MKRRTYLGSTLTAAAPLGTGVAQAQIDTSSADTTEYGDVRFGRDQSIGWINERFVEYDSPDNPAVGMEVSFRAMVLTNLQSEEERLQKANEFQWANFDFAGEQILGTLFEPVSWVLDPAKDLTESFYEKFELMKLVGVTDADQRFFDRYEYVPHIWAAGEEELFYPAGTVLDVTATVRYATQDSEPMEDPGTDDGLYVELTDAEPIDNLRTLNEDSNVGETVTFTGIQYIDEPVLTSNITEVEYDHRSDLPKPEGGALVAMTGELTDSSFDVRYLVRDNSATLSVTDQQVLIGSTHRQSWEQPTPTETDGTSTEPAGTPTGDIDGSDAPNIVAVIDVSTSMEDADTRSGRTRLRVAQESLRSLINYVEGGNRLGLVSFSEQGRAESALRPVDGERDELERTVDALSTRGDTSLGAGLSTAMDLLEPANGPKSVVLLSDGEETARPSVSEVLPDLTELGIEVYTIGMGSTADRAQLRTIADETGGEFAFAPDPEEIRSLYQQFSVEAQNRSTLASETVRIDDEESTEGTATVDGSCADAQFSLSHDAGETTLDVERPDGEPLSEGGEVTHRTGATNEVWTVENPDPGEWRYRVDADDAAGGEPATVEVSADSPVDGSLYVSDELFEQTGMIKAQVKMSEQRRRYTGADVTVTAVPADETDDRTAVSTTQAGAGASTTSAGNDASPTSEDATPTTEKEVTLRDDGQGPDGVESDGVYTTFLSLPAAGEYEFEASVSGGEVDGLGRVMREPVTVENDPQVDEPIQPYRSASAGTLGELVEQYAGPGVVVLTLVGALVGALRTMSENE